MYVSVVDEQESAILIYNYCNFFLKYIYVAKIIAIKLKNAVILKEIYSPSRGEDYIPLPVIPNPGIPIRKC